MLNGKRRHKRFEVFVVVEIKLLKAPDNFYLGITKNFSFEGFSFESQSIDFEVGDNIEFKFKHPQYSSDAFYAGEIVWKKKDNKFNSFLGVKFEEIDDAAKSKMLAIVSFASNIPVDSFLSDKCDKDIHVDEPETTGRVEEVEAAHDETLELDIEEVDDIGLQMNSGQATHDDTSPINKDQRKKTWLYIPIAIAIVVILFVIFENSNKIVEGPIPVSTKSATHEDIDKKHSIPIVVDAQTTNHLGRFRPEDIEKKNPIPLVVNAKIGNVEYYIQVGAWKYPDNAEKMLLKLKRNYPEAYITIENNLHKVRIPEIMNKKQGANISRDIEKKFNIKPMVVLKTK